MWIPHRVFFGILAILVTLVGGVMLLAWWARDWQRAMVAILGPSLACGTFLGLTATRGMPLLLHERVVIGTRVAVMFALWLAGSATVIHLLRLRRVPPSFKHSAAP